MCSWVIVCSHRTVKTYYVKLGLRGTVRIPTYYPCFSFFLQDFLRDNLFFYKEFTSIPITFLEFLGQMCFDSLTKTNLKFPQLFHKNDRLINKNENMCLMPGRAEHIAHSSSVPTPLGCFFFWGNK